MERTGGFCSSLVPSIEPSTTPAPSEPEIFKLSDQILFGSSFCRHCLSFQKNYEKYTILDLGSHIVIIQNIKLLPKRVVSISCRSG